MMPEYITQILTRLRGAGFRAYAVGGCVRDTLLGAEPHDWDVATSATVEETSRLFERTVPTGIKYGTVTVLLPGGAAEVTTFRRDGEYLDGRKPESVEFVTELREDLRRRDFTVNAMAMGADGEIIDLFGGREDLRRGVIRCVGDPEERFTEDALRMLRAVRFSARLGFEIEEKTLAAIMRLAPNAEKLSAERVHSELSKTLLSPRPEYAGHMIEYGLLSRFMSAPAKKTGLEPLRAVPEELRLAVFAVLCRDQRLCQSAGGLLRELRATSADIKLASEAEKLFSGGKMPDEDDILMALVDHTDGSVLATCAARGAYGQARAAVDSARCVRPSQLAVTGSDAAEAGLRGPEIGAALRALAVEVTFGRLKNDRAALLQVLNLPRQA